MDVRRGSFGPVHWSAQSRLFDLPSLWFATDNFATNWSRTYSFVSLCKDYGKKNYVMNSWSFKNRTLRLNIQPQTLNVLGQNVWSQVGKLSVFRWGGGFEANGKLVAAKFPQYDIIGPPDMPDGLLMSIDLMLATNISWTYKAQSTTWVTLNKKFSLTSNHAQRPPNWC